VAVTFEQINKLLPEDVNVKQQRHRETLGFNSCNSQDYVF